jgi:lysophospholipase L1-like esterase
MLGCAFAAVLLYLGEVGLRIAGVEPAYRAGASGSWRMTPNLDGRGLRGPRDGHDFKVTTNADGLRTTLTKERTPGVKRVAVMGDSTVFGWGVDDGGALSDGLQAEVAAAMPGAVEILNAGQPGYSTTQAAWLFDTVVADYTPDRVIVFIPMHDFNRVLVSDRELLDGGSDARAKARVLLASHSRIYQLLRQQIWPLTDTAMLLPDQDTGEPRVPRVSDEERARGFDAMRARLATWGGELMVGFLPFHADLVGRGGDRIGVRWAQEYTSSYGSSVVDVRACCHGEDLVLADDRGHLSAEGNRQVGVAVAPYVIRTLSR